jgi:predicted glycogen debranching enzyme
METRSKTIGVSHAARAVDEATEWLEADGLGGFASGTTSGIRTRRYHGLLLVAAAPPADRRMLVQGFVARLETPDGSSEFWPQAYGGEWVTGREVEHVEFALDPWPTWRFFTRVGVCVQVEVFVPRGAPAAVVTFRLDRTIPGARLELRPLFSGRDFHSLQHENGGCDLLPMDAGESLRFEPYPGVPGILSLANGTYHHAPDWYRGFFYAEEAARGLDAQEDLSSPGTFSFNVGASEALWVLSADLPDGLRLADETPTALVDRLRKAELARRSSLAGPLERAAQAYVVHRGDGRTLIAGYPWFGDWGRDTFIALRGICLATGDLETAGSILGEWAGVVSQGMLPNRFAEDASAPAEYNSVDASLWFVLAADEFLARPPATDSGSLAQRRSIESAIVAIVDGYARGTRHGIRRDADGLLACGEPGVQLTWMDAKVGAWVVTPRIGKPVEIQALWVHALGAASRREPRFLGWLEIAKSAFEARFWNQARGMLFDVVDADHVPGATDGACRPNQIFAAGGLPLTLLSPERARRVVDAVERELWTPLGPRSLAPGEPAYAPHYQGGPRERDGAYHQGTVWPWLAGPWQHQRSENRGARTFFGTIDRASFTRWARPRERDRRRRIAAHATRLPVSSLVFGGAHSARAAGARFGGRRPPHCARAETRVDVAARPRLPNFLLRRRHR